MLTPSCTLVNFTGDSLDWLLELCLGPDYDKSQSEFPWDIETKYYKASVCINVKQAEDLLTGADPLETLSSTEAIMFYCDTSKATLERIDSAWGKVKESCPPVCLLVVEHASDQDVKPGEASRTEILAWCLEHHFELVECDEGEEEEEEDEEEDEGIEEKLGRARVVEALKAHTWSNLELLESGPGRRPLPLEGDKESDSEGEDEQGEVGEQVRNLLAAVGSDDEDEDFGALFSQLASMRDQSSNLQGEDRKAYAEKVALAFYKAIGGGSDDEEGPV